MNPKPLLFALHVCLVAGVSLRTQAQDKYEDALAQLASGISTSLGLTPTATVLVSEFKRMDGNGCDLDAMITLDFEGALLTKPHTFRLLDRANLSTIAEEHKLAMEGMMDDEQQMKEAGRLLKADAIVFGSYRLTGNILLLRVKAVDIQSSEQLAIVPANCELPEALKGLCNEPTGDSANGNRRTGGFQIHEKPATQPATQPCSKSTGTYCFQNNAKEAVSVVLRNGSKRYELTLQPGVKECLYEKPAGAYSYTISQFAVHWMPGLRTYRQGDLMIEPCQSGSIAVP